MIGWKKKKKADCLVMDSMSKVLAKGAFESASGPWSLRVRVTEGSVKAVLHANKVQIVPNDEKTTPRLARVVDCSDDGVVAFETLRELTGAEVRTNLRMPVYFAGYIYPLSGPSKVRVPYRANDLSCGGISFFCDSYFSPGDVMEIVIPVTRTAPLLLQCQVLRERAGGQGQSLYACKFLDIIDEQESMVREAVFNAQLQYIRDQAG